jgi:hypothetical protein
MTPSKLAVALLLTSPSAWSQGGSRAGEATMTANPVVSPTTSRTTINQPLNTNTGIPGGVAGQTGVNTGVNLSGANASASASGANAKTGGVPSAGAASIGAATASEAQAKAAKAYTESQRTSAKGDGHSGTAGSATATLDPGAALMTPTAEQDPKTAPGGMGGISSKIRRAQTLESKGHEGSVSQALDGIFDSAKESSAKVGGPGWVAGKTERVQDRVRQTAKIADTASAHDAPALYKEAIKIAEDAALQKLISGETARRVADAVVRKAYSKAGKALSELANEAYKAAQSGGAGKSGVAKAVKSLSNWDKFLGGGPNKPLVLNEGELKADIERTLAEAGAGGNGVSRKVSFRREGDSFVAELPTRAGGKAGALPAGFVASLSLDPKAAGKTFAPAGSLTEKLGLFGRARLVYSRAAGQSSFSPRAAFAAAGFLARSAVRSAWEGFWNLVSAVSGRLFPGRVDLGAGQSLVSGDRALKRLSSLKRGLTDGEKELLSRKLPGTGAVFFGLAQLNREAAEAEQAAARGADNPVLKALLDKQAASYAALTGDFAAVAAPNAEGGPAHWLELLRQRTLDHLDRQMLAVARRAKINALAYGEVSGPGAMVRLVVVSPSASLAASLEALGFELEFAPSGELRAWAMGANLAARMEAALERVSGSVSAAQDEAAVGRAVAFAEKNPAKAGDLAKDFVAEDPTLSEFSAVDTFPIKDRGDERMVVAETSLRRDGGKSSLRVVLRDLSSRRVLYGHTEPLKR